MVRKDSALEFNTAESTQFAASPRNAGQTYSSLSGAVNEAQQLKRGGGGGGAAAANADDRYGTIDSFGSPPGPPANYHTLDTNGTSAPPGPPANYHTLGTNGTAVALAAATRTDSSFATEDKALYRDMNTMLPPGPPPNYTAILLKGGGGGGGGGISDATQRSALYDEIDLKTSASTVSGQNH
jgi:hypothetical protein